MVEYKTTSTFVEKRNQMDTTLLKVLQTTGIHNNKIYFCPQLVSNPTFKQLEISRGFFFLIITNGSASLNTSYATNILNPGMLIVQTPSSRSTLQHLSPDFEMTALYIEPAFFDSLLSGQPLYDRIAYYLGKNELPAVSLTKKQSDYLQKAMQLFAYQQESKSVYQDGILRYLCGFILLQMADIFEEKAPQNIENLKRNKDLFRQFKKLLMTNYRQQHNIAFYADQLNISNAYLSRIIKSVTGRTVLFHINELLCADACRLLECTNMDIKEIADLLGFTSQSAFGKFFMRQQKTTPLKYRMKRDIRQKE